MKYSFIIAFAALLAVSSCSKIADNEATLSADNKGNRIVETGELAAIDSRSFVLQRYGRHWYQMKVIGLLKHGTVVKAGDSIIQLDPTEIKKYIIDRESELETQMATFEKIKVDQSNRRSDLESNMKNEIATFNLRKLELESSRFESDRIKKIKQLEFEQAKITFEKVKRVYELNKIRESSDLKIQRIRVERLKDELKSAYDLLPTLTIRTPISGIFQVAYNRRTNSMVKVGDDLYQGTNMGNVPDLTWMKVNTTVSENDFLKIKNGLKVIVRLDALPKVSFDAEVIYISKLCRLKDEKSKQKVFDVEVKILKPDERLKPGMTVNCEFILN
jgi:HlyD family secretion protein